MPSIELKYGRDTIAFEYEPERFTVLGGAHSDVSLSDIEIGAKLDNPIDTEPIEEIVSPGESILIVVPDATRQTACGQIVNLVVRRLIANGTAPHDIRIIFATGIHRKVTDAEASAILTPFIAQRIKTLDHEPRNLLGLLQFGETSTGIPIELNRALSEHDHVIMIGGVTFHYFAGFTGGRKLICPGLASARTIAETHKLAFDCAARSRREGVDTGLLDGNAVNEAFEEIVDHISPAFAINTIVDPSGSVVEVFCGHWKSAHRTACKRYAADNTVQLAEKRDVVIVTCGGSPHDVNMIQAHKALEAASQACNDGGTIVLVAECGEGLGRVDFLDWFEAADSSELAGRLCQKYKVNGQTAWSLLRKAERFEIKVKSEINEEHLRKMRLSPISAKGISEIFKTSAATGYVFLDGARCRVHV